MKWFQHHSDAHDDEFIKEVMQRFGPEGYAAWFIIAELVARTIKVVPTPDRPPGYQTLSKLVATPSFFCQATYIPRQKLVGIIQHFAKRRKLRFHKLGRRSTEMWEIEWPKLLEFKDNTTADQITSMRRSLGSSLGSDLGVTSGLQDSAGIGSYTHTQESLKEGGVGGTDGESVWAMGVAKEFARFCHSPGIRAIQNAVLDLARQGIPKRLIEEAPMNPQYRKWGFWRIKNALEGMGEEKGAQDGGAQKVVEHFGLPSGHFGDETKRRIAERERREKEEPPGGVGPENVGGAGPVPSGDQDSPEVQKTPPA